VNAVDCCEYVDNKTLDSEPGGGSSVCAMATTPGALLVSAAASMCSAADRLRAAGLVIFAEEIESLIAILDAEILLSASSEE
jgi:hypothetical protein